MPDLRTRTSSAKQDRDERLSLTFSALSDPSRRAILSRLASGEANVTELAEPLDMTLPAVTKHLKVLERAGLIRRGRKAQWRPCFLQPEPLKEAADWVAEFKSAWEGSLDRLGAYLRSVEAASVKGSPKRPVKEKKK